MKADPLPSLDDDDLMRTELQALTDILGALTVLRSYEARMRVMKFAHAYFKLESIDRP